MLVALLLPLGGVLAGGSSAGDSANCTCTESAEEEHTSIFTLGASIYKHVVLLNVMFLLVIAVTVVMELAMYLLTRAAAKHFDLLVAHLNKELALLGMVAFILMTVESTGFMEYFSLEVFVFEWCHVILFFVALLNILSHTILHLALKWQEHHYRKFERQNQQILVSGIKGATSGLHLDFELARYVFESDRKHFFSKQLCAELTRDKRRTARESSQRSQAADHGTVSLCLDHGALSMLQEVAAAAAQGTPTASASVQRAAEMESCPSTKSNPLASTGSNRPRTLNCGEHGLDEPSLMEVDGCRPGSGKQWTIQRACSGVPSVPTSKEVSFDNCLTTSSPTPLVPEECSLSSPCGAKDAPVECLLPMHAPLCDGSVPQSPSAADGQYASSTLRADDLLGRLRRLRSFAALKARLEKVSQDARDIHKPDEFSFAEYLVRCARQELINMLHIGVLAWLFVCIIIALHLIPACLVDGTISTLRDYALAPGLILFGLFCIIWLSLVRSYWRCMRRLTKVAMLHSRQADPEENALQRTLVDVLAQRHPKMFRQMSRRNLQQKDDDEKLLKCRREQLYRSSLNKNRRTLWTPFTYPHNLNLLLQVLLLCLGFDTSVFLMTFGPRLLLPERTLEEGCYWIVGVGIPALVYFIMLPDILFRHTFLISAGDMFDLQIMRTIENEQRQKLAKHQREQQKRRILARMRRKMQLLAMFGVDSWDTLVIVLQAIPVHQNPGSIDLTDTARLASGA